VYASSKYTVEAFTRNIANDFGSKRIIVNIVAPEDVKTDMANDVGWQYLPGLTRHGHGSKSWQLTLSKRPSTAYVCCRRFSSALTAT
jgi:NAD(P)-dependent dehydrogenase (short-subunit alcohol dehydrogenase family)